MHLLFYTPFLVTTMSKVRGWKITFQKFMAITLQCFFCALVDHLPLLVPRATGETKSVLLK